MNKAMITCLLLIISLTIIPFNVLAGRTATLRFSVIIPERLELNNNPTTSDSTKETAEKISSEENQNSPATYIETTESTFQKGEEILLKTIVTK